MLHLASMQDAHTIPIAPGRRPIDFPTNNEAEQQHDNKRPFADDEECDDQDESENADITIEYHDRRTKDYHFKNLPINNEPPAESPWMIEERNVSERCYAIKSASLRFQHKAAHISADRRYQERASVHCVTNKQHV
ncbi:unnamed protein product [Absidia cylindrospora]